MTSHCPEPPSRQSDSKIDPSSGRKVLPVDTHTARIAARLGLSSSGSNAAVDSKLSRVVSLALRFNFHVNAVVHGRAVCRAVTPMCDECLLSRLCPVGAPRQKSSPFVTVVTVLPHRLRGFVRQHAAICVTLDGKVTVDPALGLDNTNLGRSPRNPPGQERQIHARSTHPPAESE